MGKTLTQMRADLRTDLRDTAALWSNAELNRCVERAVADLSRFLPLQKSYEITTDFEVTDESWTSPAAANATKIVAAADISAIADGATLTLAARTLDAPRPVTILITDADASITSFTIVVKGTDRDGNYIEEPFYFSGDLSQTSKKCFKTIVEVEVDQMTGEGAGDTLSVGTATHVGVWVQLANKPIKPGTVVNVHNAAGTAFALDTDFEMDYANGRIRLKSGGSMAAATAYEIDYDKSQIEIDLAPIKHELIRVDRLIYPASDLPQTFIGADVWGDVVTLTGGATESQESMAKAKHAVIRYLASHTSPSVGAPGSYPDFLDSTVILAASAYALFIKAVQYEHQSATDLTQVTKYLNNNAGADAAGLLAKITTDIANLRTGVEEAVDAAKAYLAEIKATDLDKVTVGAGALLDTGDDKINVVNLGVRVPELYQEYSGARVSIANARLSAALGGIQEAGTRIDNLRTYLEEAGSYDSMAGRFLSSAGTNLALAERFRAEAIERRNEAWSIWKDPKQYIGDFALTPTRVPRSYR